MENYLRGIQALLFEPRAVTGVAKENDQMFVRVDKLLDFYENIIVSAILPEVANTVKYATEGALTDEGVVSEVEKPEDISALTEENAVAYVRMDRMKKGLTRFSKDYEAELPAEEGYETTVQVTESAAYKTSVQTKNVTDWKTVVGTMVTLPHQEGEEGELNYLVDEDVSLAQKARDHPEFDLMYRHPHGVQTLYVSVESVYNRIQELKVEGTEQSNHLEVQLEQV